MWKSCHQIELGGYASATFGSSLVLGLLDVGHLSPCPSEFLSYGCHWGTLWHSLDHLLAFSFDELKVAIEWTLLLELLLNLCCGLRSGGSRCYVPDHSVADEVLFVW